MRIIENKVLPFPGFLGINLFGIIFVRKDVWEKLNAVQRETVLRHERIHTAQMLELGFLGFYFLYFLEWVLRLIFHTRTAYRGISFEREARAHQWEPGYLTRRRLYSQWRRK